jgi:hypothetical protein
MYQLTIKEKGKVIKDVKVNFENAVMMTGGSVSFNIIYNLKKSLTLKNNNQTLTIKKV